MASHPEQHRTELLEGLKTFLRIPSVSTLPEHKPDIRRAAEFVLDALRKAGIATAEFIESAEGGNPLIYGEWLHAPGKPTVLTYGHYDVQPPEPLDEWTSPPFEPVVRDGRIYARGSADDKGQILMHVKALEAHLRTTGKLPVNVIVLAEGEEEIGSPNLLPFVERWKDRLACDAVVISDSAMFDEGIPSLLFSLRGLAYFEIHVECSKTDLHSGSYGGAVPN